MYVGGVVVQGLKRKISGAIGLMDPVADLV